MKTIEVESDGTVIIPCTCGDRNCTTFLHVKPSSDIDVVFYGKRQFTIGIPQNIRQAICDAAQQERAADVASCSCELPPSAIPHCGRCGKPFKSQRR